MMGCRPIALQIIPGHPFKRRDMLRGARAQGAGNGRLLGTARPPKRPLHRRIEANRAITLGDGLGATEDAQQPIEQFVERAMADRLLGDGDLLPQGGKETVSPQILSKSAQTGTPGRHCRTLTHGALLAIWGTCLSLTLREGIYPLQECALECC